VRQNYNSIKYWESVISENKTIRGHMFMDAPPKENSLYMHTLIFSKNNGIDNIYAYFPDVKILLGYIQYSFLQEAFYKWIYGKKRLITKIPTEPVQKIIEDALARGVITDETKKIMISQYNRVAKMWDLPKDRVLPEINKFTREFNRTWFGNNQEFLYMKIFKSSVELGEFVVESTMITNDAKEFQNKIGATIDEWITICKHAARDKLIGERFQKILQKSLTEVI
jgi:hypothetical protein